MQGTKDMALIAVSTGWCKNEDTGEDEFIIKLKAETKADIPDLNNGDIWLSRPLKIERLEAAETTNT
jgi:hypothetical protein